MDITQIQGTTTATNKQNNTESAGRLMAVLARIGKGETYIKPCLTISKIGSATAIVPLMLFSMCSLSVAQSAHAESQTLPAIPTVISSLQSTSKSISKSTNKSADKSALMSSSTSHLPSASKPTATLETIVITATKTDRALSDSPIPVNVISQTQLEDNKPRTLKEVLQLLPNVILKPVHGKTGYEVLLQGLSSNQVLVLIDGLPVTASTGSTVNLNQYLNVEVAQVEVIQGASSAQYGSSAMGGVINVITKQLDASETPLSGHVSVELGSNGEQNPSGESINNNRTYVDAGIDARLDSAGHWQARLSASHMDDEGLSLDTNQWARLKDQSEQTQLSARLQYQPTAGDDRSQIWLEATSYQEDDDSRFNRRVAQNIIPRQKLESIEKNRFSAGFSHQFTANSDSSNNNSNNKQGAVLQAKLFYEDYDSASDTYNVLPSGTSISIDRDSTINTKMTQVQYDFPSLDINENHAHLLQVGGQWQEDELSQTNNGKNELKDDNVSRDVGEVYIQDDWLIGDSWEVLTGIRYQQDSDFGSHIAPKVAVKYNHLTDSGQEHILRASVGQGYRVPNLKERYFVFDHSVYGYMVEGNPELQPEVSNSYQLGYQGALTERINLTANAFYNDVSDLIDTNKDTPLMKGNVAVYQYHNVDSANTYGGDLGINWQVDDDNQLVATYAYTKTENESTGKQLVGRPEHKASLTLNSQLGDKLRLTNRLNYESKHLITTSTEEYSPSWWTMDTKVNYQATPTLKLHAGVNNLFDQQRDIKQPNDQSPIDNRQWIIGANLTF